MERYNYFEEMKKDINDNLYQYATNEELLAMMTNEDKQAIFDKVYEGMFTDDNITGGGSGSYFFSNWLAEEAICHNLDLLANALFDYADNRSNALYKGAEWCDVMIRCSLLGEALDDVLDGILSNNIFLSFGTEGVETEIKI